MPDDKEIVQMHLSEDDNGELHYTQARSMKYRSGLKSWTIKILGIAFGVAFFLLLMVFFVYVIIPLIIILILYSLIKRIFRSRE